MEQPFIKVCPAKTMSVIAALSLAFSLAASPAPAAFFQQSKVVGTGAVGASYQGWTVTLSADGNTALVGGPYDDFFEGATWVYTRSGFVWTQQGLKLKGTGSVGAAFQGYSVALSADGNTAIASGPSDDASTGAVWAYTRTAGVWSQQGLKLVGTGAVGPASQGLSVALSADGNTAVVGGYNDDGGVGAAWVFIRVAGIWSQQGLKLVGTGATGAAFQGYSVAVSADGNTALVGGNGDNAGVGAVWVFTRSAGVWTQQGGKLVGTGAAGAASQGTSVALSGDGNTAVVGGYLDDGGAGAAWVYTRSGGVWTQQGGKLVGTGATGLAFQGTVSVSGNGNTAVVGGSADDGGAGAVWVFRRSGGVWTQEGLKLVGLAAVGLAEQGASVALSADASTLVVGGVGDNSGVGAAWVYADPTVPVELSRFSVE